MRLLVIGIIIAVGIACLVWWHQPVASDGSITVAMCPECKEVFVSNLEAAAIAQCALYDVGEQMAAMLKTLDAEVITDDETNAAYGTPYYASGLMHHKFCVINKSVVVTGSYNPTDTGHLSRNNMLVITSDALAGLFGAEWRHLAEKRPKFPVRHSYVVGTVPIEVYFCPSDRCEDRVLSALAKAESNVTFFTYAFTSDAIGDALLSLQRSGVDVEGLCEPSQRSEHSECERVGAVAWEGSYLLHHKVFIIDDGTVITGSYNPTANANTRNQETLLIIHDKTIARLYRDEYESLLATSKA